MIEESCILITGGTGSFGQTMAEHLLAKGCHEIRVFSRDEVKQEEMRNRLGHPALRFYIGDVRDSQSVSRAMQGVDVTFHAAALKQVPSCEFFPLQAVMTNVGGSNNVIEEACRAGVRAVVCLSTDKAVYPINAMGMTKALMEKLVQASVRAGDSSGTVVSCVRYGNVMYSRGSVIPLFVHQIKSGRHLTVTDPSMTRFMLPLADAVELVEFALFNSDPGDLFIRKAPAATIGDLGEAIQQLFGKHLEYKTIGIRHGEKQHETLATKEELRRSEDLGDYLRIRVDIRSLNYDEYFVTGDPGEIGVEDYHSGNAERLDVPDIVRLLRSLPEIQREVGR
jgi:UDP-N-acetylglucosamine 4,6-dehydratase